MEKLLSVVIVTYKNEEIVSNCLESIYEFNDIGNKLEVIIIDNSPDFNVRNYVVGEYPDVKFNKNKNNGFGEANNKGAKLAKGKYILFLNPDTILVEPIFQFAIEKFEGDMRLGLFGIKLVDKDLKRNMSFYLMEAQGLLDNFLTKISNKLDIYINGKMFIAGADMFIRKELFIEVEGFDEKIFMYNEEPDLTRRIISSGYKTGYFKNKQIIHLEGTSMDNYDSLERALKSSYYYYSKYRLDYFRKLDADIRVEKVKKFVYSLFKPESVHIIENRIRIFEHFRNTL